MNERRIIIKCCRCRRIRLKDRWVGESEEVVRGRPLFSHRYCPACMEQVQANIQVLPMPAVC